jgi:hypothetical protein
MTGYTIPGLPLADYKLSRALIKGLFLINEIADMMASNDYISAYIRGIIK